MSTQLSARSRLTLLYASLFTLGGAVLVLITYLLVAHTLHATTSARIPPAVQQEIAGRRQHVVGIAAIDPRHREACGADQRMAAMADDLFVMVRNKA